MNRNGSYLANSYDHIHMILNGHFGIVVVLDNSLFTCVFYVQGMFYMSGKPIPHVTEENIFKTLHKIIVKRKRGSSLDFRISSIIRLITGTKATGKSNSLPSVLEAEVIIAVMAWHGARSQTRKGQQHEALAQLPWNGWHINWHNTQGKRATGNASVLR